MLIFTASSCKPSSCTATLFDLHSLGDDIKMVLKDIGGMEWIGFIWQMSGCCEQGDEPSLSKNAGNFLHRRETAWN
jgi:hypothetical protein